MVHKLILAFSHFLRRNLLMVIGRQQHMNGYRDLNHLAFNQERVDGRMHLNNIPNELKDGEGVQREGQSSNKEAMGD